MPASDVQFLVEMIRVIREANAKVATDRQLVHNIWVNYIKTSTLTQAEEDKLSALSNTYNINSFQLDDKADKTALAAEFSDLLMYVDVIPEKLVLAQAIIESAWGKSRFAKDANNYFGVHCYSKGCGLPPSEAQDVNFEVKKYASVLKGVEDYIRILNTNRAYEELRQLRAAARKDNEQPNAMELAKGLTRYSQKGSAYITIIHSVISNSIPKNLDAFMKTHTN